MCDDLRDSIASTSRDSTACRSKAHLVGTPRSRRLRHLVQGPGPAYRVRGPSWQVPTRRQLQKRAGIPFTEGSERRLRDICDLQRRLYLAAGPPPNPPPSRLAPPWVRRRASKGCAASAFADSGLPFLASVSASRRLLSSSRARVRPRRQSLQRVRPSVPTRLSLMESQHP